MDSGTRRWRGFERAAELVGAPLRRELGSWERLVGPMLAAETALVGRDRHGVLRVAARNEAARREIVARADDIVAAFNLQAQALGAATVSGVACWVAVAFKEQVSAPATFGPRGARAPIAPVSDEVLAQAEREVAATAPHADPKLRASLVRWRARSLAQRGGS